MITMTAARKSNKWLALLAVTAAYSYTFISRYIWSPLMGDVSAEFMLTSTQGGLYMSAFFVGYIITQVPGGMLADRVEPKYLLTIATALVGISTSLMALVHQYSLGIVFRVMGGLASGFIMSCCSKVIANEFEAHERGIALGILMASPPFGITLANLIGPMLGGALGWRGTFLFVGLLAAAVVAVLMLFVRKVEKRPVAQIAQTAEKSGFIQGFLAFMRNPSQLFLVAAGFMFMFTTTGFPTWASKFTEAMTFTKVEGMVIAMSYSLAGVLGSISSGLIAKKAKMSHKTFLLVTLGLMAVISIILAVRWSFPYFLGISIVYGLVSYLPPSHFVALAIDMSDPKYSATAVASQNLFQQSASVLQPIILGWGIDTTGSYSILWYAFAVAMALAVVLTTRCRAHKWEHPVQKSS